jgi:hypothetical protein
MLFVRSSSGTHQSPKTRGSSDPGVILDNYLSETERRKHQHEAMYDKLAILPDSESMPA